MNVFRAPLVAAAVTAAASLFSQGLAAAQLAGLTTDNKLVVFDAANPAVLLSTQTITGLQSGENVLGIDSRPANGTLLAFTSASRLYVINPATGAATQVGTAAFAPPFTGAEAAFDFNPAVDRIRLVSDGGQNLRLHPDTGAVAGTDTTVAYAMGDANAGRTPAITGAAYANPYAGTSQTTMYAIDATQDVLVTQGGPLQNPSPNTGMLFTTGALGFDTSSLVGFDISPANVAMASLTAAGAAQSALYAINLGSGRATKIGDIGGTAALRDIAFLLPAGGTNVYILPSSAKSAGLGGSVYTTDLAITNTNATDVTFSLRFLGNNRDGRTGAERFFTLGANKSALYTDVLGSVFGETSTFGALRVVAETSGLVVSGQTSTPGAGGTFGQSVPAARSVDLVRAGAPQVIHAIRQDAAFRTNLVLTNATEAALDVDVALVGEDGTQLATKRYSLAPLGMTQVSGVVRDLGVATDLVAARLVLSTPTTSGSFAAYAAVIDAGTNDPRTLLPR